MRHLHNELRPTAIGVLHLTVEVWASGDLGEMMLKGMASVPRSHSWGWSCMQIIGMRFDVSP